MELSRNWLGDYVDLPSDEELAKTLTDAGLAVEGMRAEGDDLLLDLDITTNRPDCMCHLGLAREAAAVLGRTLRRPETAVDAPAEGEGETATDLMRIRIEDPALCQRYVALVVRGVQVGPSPEWMRQRLESIGVRSINNVVDITNYVLWETGQPLHAFDLAKLRGGEIGIRWANSGERLTTLDGEARKLDTKIPVITDGAGAVALAGIMGGADSEVSDQTTDVLLESAHFDPLAVRRGAKAMKLNTDASKRFERGADPEACLWAARRAAELMVELAGGRLLPGVAEDRHFRSEWPPRVELELERLNRFAGIELSAERVEQILTRLGFELEQLAPGRWRVQPPSWRYYDFSNAFPADLYEEVLRQHGFAHIPSTLPGVQAPDIGRSAGSRRRRRVQDHLAACGYVEAVHYAFLARETDATMPSLLGDSSQPVALANPLSDLYAVMRRSLAANLLAGARYNQHRQAAAVRLFEVGHVFARGEDGTREIEAVALVAGGTVGTPWEQGRALDFYDLKGIVESLAARLGASLAFRAAQRPGLQSGTSAEILSLNEAGEETIVGFLGQVAGDDRAYPLFLAELDLDALCAGAESSLYVQGIPKYPSILMDSTLTHDLNRPWAELAAAIEEARSPELASFRLKDRYQGKGVPEGAVNTTITFTYVSPERSLTHEEVNEQHHRLAQLLEQKLGWVAGT